MAQSGYYFASTDSLNDLCSSPRNKLLNWFLPWLTNIDIATMLQLGNKAIFMFSLLCELVLSMAMSFDIMSTLINPFKRTVYLKRILLALKISLFLITL